jgi:hypothetical protein
MMLNRCEPSLKNLIERDNGASGGIQVSGGATGRWRDAWSRLVKIALLIFPAVQGIIVNT